MTKTFVRILPAVGSLCMVLVSLFYLFTMFGIEWYGIGDVTAQLSKDNPLLHGTDWMANAAVLGYHNVVDGLYTTFQVRPVVRVCYRVDVASPLCVGDHFLWRACWHFPAGTFGR